MILLKSIQSDNASGDGTGLKPNVKILRMRLNVVVKTMIHHVVQ